MDTHRTPKPTRRLRIDLTDLEEALEGGPDRPDYFLDLETGRVIVITEDVRSDYRALKREIGSVEASQWEAAFAAAMEAEIPEWEQGLMRDIEFVEKGFPETCIRVPAADSTEGFQDMEAFIETVPAQRLRGSLERAIGGRRPFRAFKDVLAGDPPERERWFKFKQALLRERALEWLAEEGIELLSGSDPAAPAG
ncbi:MAG: UPF0158 family protein [Anaerolineales bacterium]